MSFSIMHGTNLNNLILHTTMPNLDVMLSQEIESHLNISVISNICLKSCLYGSTYVNINHMYFIL